MLVLVGGGIAFSNERSATVNTAYIEIAGQMRMLTQRLSKAALLAVQGKEPAFAQLQESRDGLARDLALLTAGGDNAGVNLPPSPASAQGALADLAKTWEGARASADTILAAKPILIELGRAFDTVNAGNAGLLDAAEQLTGRMAQAGSSNRDLAAANQLVMLTQRIAKNANLLHVSETIDPESAFLLSKDTSDFAERVRGLSSGNETLRLTAQPRRATTML